MAEPAPWLAGLLEGAPGGVERLEPCHGIESLRVMPASLIPLCQRARAAGFTMCLDVAGVDYLPREPRFEVVYHLLALKGDGTPEQPRRLQLRVPVAGERPEVPTVSGIWPSANWPEREVYDLMGIRFKGHPDLRRILMPDDWEGHPLRKDYPLRGPRALEEEELPLGHRFDFLQARVRPHER
ncbi:NADH-quinone oxidoreductase subunit C [Limnochorda pilosa]|uniref:NADH-quinone oxidoreductase subunit C n=1 Tax=Limnochorda pilosa TaxID=1555112 RepID=A0A0K2SP96_LIMPI|nr:NADH-quinone oxidoreductase subunit C [Limnochorda pilosa]